MFKILKYQTFRSHDSLDCLEIDELGFKYYLSFVFCALSFSSLTPNFTII